MSQPDFPTLARTIASPDARFHPITAIADWCAAKDLRGQPIDTDRLARIGAPAHLAAPRPLQQIDTLRARIRARAARIGITGPAPLILPDPAA